MRDPAGADSAAVALARRLGLGDDLVHPDRRPGRARRRRRAAPGARRTLVGVPGDLAAVAAVAQPAADADRDAGRPLLAPGGGRLGRGAGAVALRRRDVRTAGRPDARRRLRRTGRQPLAGCHDAGAAAYGAHRAHPDRRGPRRPGRRAATDRRAGLRHRRRRTLPAGRRRARRPPARRSGSTPPYANSRHPGRLAADGRPDPGGADRRRRRGGARAAGAARGPAAGRARPASAATVGELDYASVALVTLVLPEPRLPELSGFLVPADRGADRSRPPRSSPPSGDTCAGPDGLALVRASVGRYGEEAALQRLRRRTGRPWRTGRSPRSSARRCRRR